jgi:hypothetical protein
MFATLLAGLEVTFVDASGLLSERGSTDSGRGSFGLKEVRSLINYLLWFFYLALLFLLLLKLSLTLQLDDAISLLLEQCLLLVDLRAPLLRLERLLKLGKLLSEELGLIL